MLCKSKTFIIKLTLVKKTGRCLMGQLSCTVFYEIFICFIHRNLKDQEREKLTFSYFNKTIKDNLTLNLFYITFAVTIEFAWHIS